MVMMSNPGSSTQTTHAGRTHERSGPPVPPWPADEVLVAVFEDQRAGLRRFFVRSAGSPAPAEDLLQETLLRAWGHRDALASTAEGARREAFDGARRYVWRVARNLVIDEIRAGRRRRARPLWRGMELEARHPADDLEHAQRLQLLHEAVRGLSSERVRRCLALWLDGCDVNSIAARLALRPGQVRGLLQRGRADVVRRARECLRVSRAVARSA